ncbi:hypothetical protein MKX03_035908 [Papaver bracteatum]|nr:hypothetical protein MKX03_035908 [Papaver bracteatum]
MDDIIRAKMFDIPMIQVCFLLSFPEEDPWDYYLYEEYIVSWPRLVYVEEYLYNDGIGLQRSSWMFLKSALVQEYGSEYVSLHVRTNAYVMRKQLQGKQIDHLGHRLIMAVAEGFLVVIELFMTCFLTCIVESFNSVRDSSYHGHQP